jgi:adenosylmethionine-8-amino-7-oxononanoate aminotransferase
MSDNGQQLAAYPIWHPFTQMQTAGMPLRVESAEGEFLHLSDGRTVVDGISSWWVTLHGHSNKEIAQAIYEQANRLEHVIFAGFTHEPAEQLASGLLSKLPESLRKVFFSDNGSTSVEVALKMAFQYWRNLGVPQRKRFIGFAGGYHGDTLGAMSAGGSSSFWKVFSDLMFQVDIAPFPATWEGDDSIEAKEAAALEQVKTLLEQGHGQHAAIIIEPLVQGAAGMHMCRKEFLAGLRSLATGYNTLLIFDEVMTGFGRTGSLFACTKSGVTPDIICLSKGITGGCLPLAVTVSTETIYDAFLSDKLEQALFHSHSYTGNPIACAAANASLKILEKSMSVVTAFENRHRAMAGEYLADTRLFGKLRFCGTIVACDINAKNCDYYSSMAAQLRCALLDKGVLIRPLGTTIYLMPPLCTSDKSLHLSYSAIQETARQALGKTKAVVR